MTRVTPAFDMSFRRAMGRIACEGPRVTTKGSNVRPPTADLPVESTLRHCDLLEPLSDAQIAALADRATILSLAEGEALFTQNAEARHLFIVASGRLSIRLSTPGGHAIEVVDASPYRLSGWSSLVAPHNYIADARAEEASTVLVIPAAEAEEVFVREPAAAYEVMKRLAAVISTRLRDIKEELIEVLGG
jgi:CRP-like cAMP-binding protein